MDEYAADQAFDGNRDTRWATDGGTHSAWIERDLGKPLTFGRVRISEACGDRVQKFELQYQVGEEWKTALSGTTLGEKFEAKFPPVTAQRIRLNILEATEGPTIWEIELLPSAQ